jgi:hypothetical protein
MHTVLSSATKTVTIGDDVPFVIIGERLNPTGRKLFQEKLRADDLSTINIDVADQVAGGCDMLDVNMGVPLTDEPDLLARAIKLVQSLTDLPICIDSSVIEALDAGLLGEFSSFEPGLHATYSSDHIAINVRKNADNESVDRKALDAYLSKNHPDIADAIMKACVKPRAGQTVIQIATKS